MRARLQTASRKLASLHLIRRLKQYQKFWRFTALCLAADVVGFTLVYFLTSRGVLGKWTANEVVSKGMAPIGLALNTLALTGTLRPTRSQAVKWTIYWLPTALLGTISMAVVVTQFGLGSLESRAVAGLMVFPFDYTVKRFIVFSKQIWLTNLLLKKQLWLANLLFQYKFALVVLGVLIWRRLRPTNCCVKPLRTVMA